MRIDLDRDLQGWRPPAGMTDDLGQEIEDRIYNQRDMDRVLILNERTQRVAEKIVEYMLSTDPYGKTIVFCENIDHAERMRSALVNEIAKHLPEEASNTSKFVVRITGDSDEGRLALDDFIHPEHRYPVIATTSKLLTTGVDVRTCKLIVIDQRIESLIEFKQIIGRGTRIHEDMGKLWFTIMDFRKATEQFADPDFDGTPIVIYEPPRDYPILSDDNKKNGDDKDLPIEGATRYVVSGVEVQVLAERVHYLDRNGKLITESLTDYTRKTVQQEYATLDDFLQRWNEAERKAAIIEELGNHGVLFEELRAQVGREFDVFDLICHIVYDQPMLTRRQRAREVKKRDVFARYGAQARAVLNALIDKYADEGLAAVEDPGVLRVQPLSDLGTPVELARHFGDKNDYTAAVQALAAALYDQVA